MVICTKKKKRGTTLQSDCDNVVNISCLVNFFLQVNMILNFRMSEISYSYSKLSALSILYMQFCVLIDVQEESRSMMLCLSYFMMSYQQLPIFVHEITICLV